MKSLAEIAPGLVLYVPFCLFLWRAVFKPNGRYLVKIFEGAAQLDLSSDVRAEVERVLVRAARIRRAFLAFCPFVLATIALLSHIRPWMEPLSNYFIWFGLYAAGSVIASMTMRLAEPEGAKTALLAPRQLDDYVPVWVLWTARLSALVSIAVGAGVILNRHNSAYGQVQHYDTTAVMWLMVTPLLAVVVSEIYGRLLLARAQVVANAEAGAADDAMRMLSIRRAGRVVATFAVVAVGHQWWALAATYENGLNFAAANLLRCVGVAALFFALLIYVQTSAINSIRFSRLQGWMGK